MKEVHYHYAILPWLRTLESNQPSGINSPPPTPCLLVRNILYYIVYLKYYQLVRGEGVEPSTKRWQRLILPLN